MRKRIRNCFLVGLVVLVVLVSVSFWDTPALTTIASYRVKVVDNISSWWDGVFPPFPYDITVVKSAVGKEDIYARLEVEANQQTELGEQYCLRDATFAFASVGESHSFTLYISPEEAAPFVHSLRQRLEAEVDLLAQQLAAQWVKLREYDPIFADMFGLSLVGSIWGNEDIDRAARFDSKLLPFVSVIRSIKDQLRVADDKLTSRAADSGVSLSDLAPFLACQQGGDNVPY